MKKSVELPFVEPIYSTYSHQAIGSTVIYKNPSIRNWYLNESMNLMCDAKFCFGYTTPFVRLTPSGWRANPHLNSHTLPLRFLNRYTNAIIREMLDNDYYVAFYGIDDYYIEGKCWYQEKHVHHDGLICGYDQNEKTFTLQAYDSRWIYRRFKTSQKGFDLGRISMDERGDYSVIYGIKPKTEQVALQPERVCFRLREYLDSSFEKYPIQEDTTVYGIVVHDYVAMYMDKMFDGSIAYERKDRRVLRQIWEHKKVMLERLIKTESALELDSALSTAYAPLVSEANAIRMLYASHNMKRRDSVLPTISNKLHWIKEVEQDILHEFVEKAEGALK